MIIGRDRETVVENIRKAAESGDFYAKVELDDPTLTAAESREIIRNYLRDRNKISFRFRSFWARRVDNIVTALVNWQTEIVSHIDDRILKDGAIITSNHFSPLENTVIRHYVQQHTRRKFRIVSQVTNFAMRGFLGFLMNYADTIPLPTEPRALAQDFTAILQESLQKKEVVLIYPEQEMWFQYRKPRPPKKGAYHFAAKLQKPVISCFVEIVDTGKPEKDPAFHKTAYRLHVLDVLYPDPAKSVRDNSRELCERDYALKTAAYEACYRKPLSYTFEQEDIAGYVGERHG